MGGNRATSRELVNRRWIAVLALALVALAGCGGSGSGSETLTVYAASSLTDAFTEISMGYEAQAVADGRSVEVVVVFEGSTLLATQIAEEAPADVFASADQIAMDVVVDALGDEVSPVPFASNELALIAPRGEPPVGDGLALLEQDDLVVALCSEAVPCGRVTAAALADAGIEPSVDAFEPSVRSVLTRVRLGEADLGVVYASDVIAGGDAVVELDVAWPASASTDYLITTVGEPDQAASDFVAYVQSDAGTEVLERWGFIGGPVGPTG